MGLAIRPGARSLAALVKTGPSTRLGIAALSLTLLSGLGAQITVNSLTAIPNTLGGTTSWAGAINSSGVVLGAVDVVGGDTHGFVYSGGTMTDLGTLGGSYAYAN